MRKFAVHLNIAILAICFSWTNSFAIQEYMTSGNALNINTILRSAYMPNGGAGTTSCTLCHPSGSMISANTFGEHFRTASIAVAGSAPIRSAAQLAMVVQNATLKSTDSDRDGFSNELEFRANSNPNDPNSTPNSTTTSTTTTTTRVIIPPIGGATVSATPDPKGNALSGGCSGGKNASFTGPESGQQAVVWFGLCALPLLGLALRRKK